MNWGVLILLTMLVLGMLVLSFIDPGNPAHR